MSLEESTSGCTIKEGKAFSDLQKAYGLLLSACKLKEQPPPERVSSIAQSIHVHKQYIQSIQFTHCSTINTIQFTHCNMNCFLLLSWQQRFKRI